MKRPDFIPPLPLDTADAARSIFNIDNVYLSIGDRIDQLISDLNLDELDFSGGIPVDVASMLAMVTIFQYAENLPDRLAVEALHSRTDWKYALHLSLVYPDLEPSALCEFRQQLLSNSPGKKVFHDMLVQMASIGLISSRSKNWSDAKSVLLDICAITRVDLLTQAFRLSLEALATYQLDFLREITLPHWYERYHSMPAILSQVSSRQELEPLVRTIGKDTLYLLEATNYDNNISETHIPEIEDLRRIYNQQFDPDGYQVNWRVICSYCSGNQLSHST